MNRSRVLADLAPPSGWDAVPAGAVLTPVARTGYPDERLLSVSKYRGVHVREDGDSHSRPSEDLSHYLLTMPGDLVINIMLAWDRGLGVTAERGLVSPAYATYTVDERRVDPRFLNYQVRSEPAIAEWRRRSYGIQPSRWRLYWERMSSAKLLLPPLDTQRRIADMLDAETARIDTLIEKNERVIELAWLRYRVLRLRSLGGGYELGSARASEWAEARGWPVAPLWLISVNHDSRRIPLNAEERGLRQGPYPYWGANSIQDHIDSWLFDGPHVLIGEDGAPFFVEERDVAWVAEGRYWVNNHAHVLEAVGVDTWWLAECLNVVDYSLFVTGSTRDKLTQDGLNRIPVPTPSSTERAAVLRELKRARELAAELADHCRRQQELLRLRRQALITAAVTGEIEI